MTNSILVGVGITVGIKVGLTLGAALGAALGATLGTADGINGGFKPGRTFGGSITGAAVGCDTSLCICAEALLGQALTMLAIRPITNKLLATLIDIRIHYYYYYYYSFYYQGDILTLREVVGMGIKYL